MKLTAIWAVCLAAISAHGAEFVGYVNLPEGARFGLVDQSREETPEWLAIGDSFKGRRLDNFDSSADKLSLSGTNGPESLAFRPDLPRSQRMKISGTVELGAESFVLMKAFLAVGEANRLPLRTGLVLNVKAVRQENGAMKYFVLLEKSKAGGGKEVLAAPTLVSAPGQGFGSNKGAFTFAFAVE